MYLKSFKTNVLKYFIELDPADFLSTHGLAQQACLKKTEVKLELLTDNNMLMNPEKEITSGICHGYTKGTQVRTYKSKQV